MEVRVLDGVGVGTDEGEMEAPHLRRRTRVGHPPVVHPRAGIVVGASVVALSPLTRAQELDLSQRATPLLVGELPKIVHLLMLVIANHLCQRKETRVPTIHHHKTPMEIM